MGVCDLMDCIGPLTTAQFRRNAALAAIPPNEATLEDGYDKTYAWVMAKPRRLTRPVAYEHPSGAVSWVTLSPKVEREVLKHIKTRH